ncbi:helix-turn-helix domain-containing protein [Dongia sp.]|uniref:helix-turn-helix domain-containing protein n=1 Tax=Dongia sp. TaxID=1977262 RepID=UPI0035AF93BB
MTAKLTERIRSLGHIANLINAGHELGDVLNLVVTAVCQRSSWSSSAIMAADEGIGFSVLVARFDPLFEAGRRSVDKWLLSTSPTRTVLADRRPIIIEDAQKNEMFPGYRQEAIERDYHTVVLLPFSTVDEQERGLVLSVHSHEHRRVDEEEMAFLETVALLGSLAVEKARRTRLDEVQRAQLLGALDISQIAMDHVLGREDVVGFVRLADEHLQAPFLLADFVTNRLLRGGGAKLPADAADSEALRALHRHLRDTESGQFDRVEALALNARQPDAKERMLVEPCLAAGQVLGGIVLLVDKPLNAAAALTAQQLRAACTVLLLRQHIRFEAEAETHGAFFARLFSADWRDEAAMLSRAHHLGLALDEPGQLAAISLRGMGEMSGEIEQAVARLLRRILPGGAAFRDDRSIVIFLPLKKAKPDSARKLLEQLLREIEWLTRSAPVACLGQVCQRLEDYPPARRQIGTLLTLAEKVGRAGIAETADFGPLARLVALADAGGLRDFVGEIVGKIEAHDAAHDGELLVTLEQFLIQRMRLQATADALGIHVTTLRYRLRRAADLFDLDLKEAESRLGLELALRLRRLLG